MTNVRRQELILCFALCGSCLASCRICTVCCILFYIFVEQVCEIDKRFIVSYMQIFIYTEFKSS